MGCFRFKETFSGPFPAFMSSPEVRSLEEGEGAALLTLDKEGKKVPNKVENVKDKYDPDGGWGWVVMVASFFCNLVLDGIAYVFGIFLDPLMEHYKVQKGPMSIVGSILAGTIQLVGPFVAILVEKFGTRLVCISGAVVSAFGFFAATFAPSVPVLTLLYGLVGGAGLGLMYIPAQVAVGYYFDKKRALATGIITCGSGAGTFILAPLAATLLNSYGWEGATRIFAGLCFQCAVCGMVMRPLPRRPTPPSEDKEETGCKSALTSAFSPQLFTNIPFVLQALSNLFATQGLYIPYMYLPGLAVAQGIRTVDASFLISIVGISNTLGRIMTGGFTDLTGVSPLIITTVALGLGGVSSALMTACSSYFSFVLVSVMFGVTLSAWCAVTSPSVVEVLGLDLLTMGFGAVTFVRGCAALTGPPMAGFIADASGNPLYAFYCSAGLLVISSVIFGMSWMAHRGKQDKIQI